MNKEKFFRISRDIFLASFATLVVFSLLEWAEPGFVSYYISFNWLLIIPIIFGTVTVALDKSRPKDK